MFSVVPLNKSTMLSFTLHPCTYYASNLKFNSFASWPDLMQPLKANLHYKTKDMRVEVKIPTYPTPLIWTPRIHHVSSDDNISFDPSTLHSTATKQSHCKPVQCQLSFSSSDNEESSADDITFNYCAPQNPMGFAQQPHSKSIYITCDDLEEDEEEEDFQTITLYDGTTRLQRKFQIDVCVYMNIEYHIHWVHTHVHIWIILLHPTTTHWISVTFQNSKTWWPPPLMRIFLL